MDLTDISKINRSRGHRWHDRGEPWLSSDWSNALAGEAGELQEAIEAIVNAMQHALAVGVKTGALCNTVKKVRRHDTGVVHDRVYNTPAMAELIPKLRDEIADVFLYLDLLADYFSLELEECIFPKFNLVSEIQGFPERLGDG